MAGRVVEVLLPNNTVALVRVAESDGTGGPAEKVGGRRSSTLTQVSGTLDGIAQAVRSGLEKAKPSKTTVELGIQLAVKNGKLTSLLVEGQADASLKVTLEWSAEPSPKD